jgi:hypothetical protein
MNDYNQILSNKFKNVVDYAENKNKPPNYENVISQAKKTINSQTVDALLIQQEIVNLENLHVTLHNANQTTPVVIEVMFDTSALEQQLMDLTQKQGDLMLVEDDLNNRLFNSNMQLYDCKNNINKLEDKEQELKSDLTEFKKICGDQKKEQQILDFEYDKYKKQTHIKINELKEQKLDCESKIYENKKKYEEWEFIALANYNKEKGIIDNEHKKNIQEINYRNITNNKSIVDNNTDLLKCMSKKLLYEEEKNIEHRKYIAQKIETMYKTHDSYDTAIQKQFTDKIDKLKEQLLVQADQLNKKDTLHKKKMLERVIQNIKFAEKLNNIYEEQSAKHVKIFDEEKKLLVKKLHNVEEAKYELENLFKIRKKNYHENLKKYELKSLQYESSFNILEKDFQYTKNLLKNRSKELIAFTIQNEQLKEKNKKLKKNIDKNNKELEEYNIKVVNLNNKVFSLSESLDKCNNKKKVQRRWNSSTKISGGFTGGSFLLDYKIPILIGCIVVLMIILFLMYCNSYNKISTSFCNTPHEYS